MEIWTDEDEQKLQVRLKHLIKLLELKNNKISLQDYLNYLHETKTSYEKDKYLKALKELLELD